MEGTCRGEYHCLETGFESCDPQGIGIGQFNRLREEGLQTGT